LRENAVNKDVARRILTAARDLEAKIGELDRAIGQLDDEKERQDYARALGDVIGIISEHFVRRIARRYPELDPDR
jgi:hypothetical protein